jgi:predicted transport protein
MNYRSAMTEEENPLSEQRLNNALDGLEDYYYDHLKNRISKLNALTIVDYVLAFTKEPLTAIAKRNPAAKKITEEIKVYNEEDLLKIAEDKVKELYQELKVAVTNLGTDVEVRPTKMYIAFRRKKGFAGVVELSSKLKVYLSIDISQLQDPLKKARDVKKIGHYSSGDTEIVLSKRDEIPYTLSLIKQAYERN